MTLRQIIKFQIGCDGYKPNGQLCPCCIYVEGLDRLDAEWQAKRYGWREDHRGWICNADGHRGDQDKEEA